VRRAARKVNQLSGNCENVNRGIGKEISEISSHWMGKAELSYEDYNKHVMNQVKSLKNELQDLTRDIDRVAREIEREERRKEADEREERRRRAAARAKSKGGSK